MVKYCIHCKELHEEGDLCPKHKKQLKEHPEWLGDVADFTTTAGTYELVTSQVLDNVANSINKVTGTNLSYEGTHQFMRDIQVFKRLNEEPFKKCGAFFSSENAQTYFEVVKDKAQLKPRVLTSFESKLTGYSQEVDWLRTQNSKLSSIVRKSNLLDGNAPGIDGVTINRFTGNEINRTTIKASTADIKGNIYKVKKAIENGTATENDIIFASDGAKSAAKSYDLKNPVVEMNSSEEIKASNKRLEQKIEGGQMSTAVTMEQVGEKMLQGATVGAVIGLTVSAITTYMKYKNGELDIKEAFKEVSKDTAKGALVGGGMGAITVFLPLGPIGFVAGMAIGLYIDKACKNILDEIYGDGAYGAILNASGYVYGEVRNLSEYYKEIKENNATTEFNLRSAGNLQKEINDRFDRFEQMKGE